MTIVEPITIADADYTGGNLVEDDDTDGPEWVDGTDYERGDRVRTASTHGIYQCLADHTAEDGVNDPLTEAAALADPLTDDPNPRHWVYVSRTNKWRLFDDRPSQRSEAPEVDEDSGDDHVIEAEVTLPSRISAMAILEMIDASEAVIELIDADGDTYFTRTVNLADTTAVLDWESYFYSAVRLRDSYITTLPYTATGDELHVTITGGENLACGQIVMGLGQGVGDTQPGKTGAEGLDFSGVETNVFGDLTTVRRAATNIHRFDIFMPAVCVNAFQAIMRDLRGGRRALFIGSERQGLRAWQYGFVRDSQVYYQDHESAFADLTIQGVV